MIRFVWDVGARRIVKEVRQSQEFCVVAGSVSEAVAEAEKIAKIPEWEITYLKRYAKIAEPTVFRIVNDLR